MIKNEKKKSFLKINNLEINNKQQNNNNLKTKIKII